MCLLPQTLESKPSSSLRSEDPGPPLLSQIQGSAPQSQGFNPWLPPPDPRVTQPLQSWGPLWTFVSSAVCTSLFLLPAYIICCSGLQPMWREESV